MKIGFIGLGKLGMPCAEVMASKGYEVTGYDIDKRESDIIDIKYSVEDTVKDKDLVFIAVPTPHDALFNGEIPISDKDPVDFDYGPVKGALMFADSFMNENQTIVLISTVLPGTIRRELIQCVKNAKFIYNPYLIAMGSVAWDMVNPEMVMIGTEDGSETGDAKQLVDFYKTIMENDPRYVIGTWDECEAIKIFYNTFISTKISLVNMIQDVAMRQGNINVDIVTKALADSDMRITGPQYMTAGMGDGGACHPRDNIALRHMAKRLDLGYDIFSTVMFSREKQAENLADFILYHANKNNMPIYIHGRAYKPGVPYTDGSYSHLINHYLAQKGMRATYIDPLTNNSLQPLSPGVFLLAHSASTTYGYSDVEIEDSLYCHIPDGSIVIDPWRKYSNEKCTVIHYGNTRQK